MNYLIDGHNLIGSNLFDDIQLSDEDDEAKLVLRLKIWQSSALKRSKGIMTVIFDRGLPGGLDVKMGGVGVEVIFATNPAQADDLIKRRLRRAKPGLILVTNDEALQREASLYGVTGWRGAEFVEHMRPRVPERPEAGTESEVRVSKEEVDEWLALFRADRAAKRARKLQSPVENSPNTTEKTQPGVGKVAPSGSGIPSAKNATKGGSKREGKGSDRRNVKR